MPATDRDESHQRAPFQVPDAPFPEPVEAALAAAVVEATKAGQWDVVLRVTEELRQRREAQQPSNVVPMRQRR